MGNLLFQLMKGPKEETNAFYRCNTVRETFWFLFIYHLKYIAFTKVKGDAKLQKLACEKGYHLSL